MLASGPFHYTVKGCWPFPTDMLRHDGSAAETQADQDLIDRLAREHAPDRAAFCAVEIKLVGPSRPNTARWESFTWEVPTDHVHALYRAAAARKKLEEDAFASALGKLTADERQIVLARMAAGNGNE